VLDYQYHNYHDLFPKREFVIKTIEQKATPYQSFIWNCKGEVVFKLKTLVFDFLSPKKFYQQLKELRNLSEELKELRKNKIGV